MGQVPIGASLRRTALKPPHCRLGEESWDIPNIKTSTTANGCRKEGCSILTPPRAAK